MIRSFKIVKNKLKESIGNLQFTITKKMKKTLLEIIVTKQLLDENNLTWQERKLLELHFDKLMKWFSNELQTRNPVQIKIFYSFMENEIDE